MTIDASVCSRRSGYTVQVFQYSRRSFNPDLIAECPGQINSQREREEEPDCEHHARPVLPSRRAVNRKQRRKPDDKSGRENPQHDSIGYAFQPLINGSKLSGRMPNSKPLRSIAPISLRNCCGLRAQPRHVQTRAFQLSHPARQANRA